MSRDSGVTWETVLEGAPVSMVEASPDGRLYAFVLGRGLLSADEGSLDFQTVSSDWGDRFILHLALDPNEPARLFGATQEGAILVSVDGGKTWTPFGR